jgi:hypothetical protein
LRFISEHETTRRVIVGARAQFDNDAILRIDDMREIVGDDDKAMRCALRRTFIDMIREREIERRGGIVIQRASARRVVFDVNSRVHVIHIRLRFDD